MRCAARSSSAIAKQSSVAPADLMAFLKPNFGGSSGDWGALIRLGSWRDQYGHPLVSPVIFKLVTLFGVVVARQL
jgi:hypothetical protein